MQLQEYYIFPILNKLYITQLRFENFWKDLENSVDFNGYYLDNFFK